MPFIAPRPIISGQPYPVLQVQRHQPTALQDFVGEISFVVELADGPHVVHGVGTLTGTAPGPTDGTAPHAPQARTSAQAMAGEVHVYEKDSGSSKDVRVWAITEDTPALDASPAEAGVHESAGSPARRFTAEHISPHELPGAHRQ